MIADRPTTITIPTSLVRRLKLYKSADRSYAAVLEDFMDAIPPSKFLERAERELARPVVEYRTVRARLGLRSR